MTFTIDVLSVTILPLSRIDDISNFFEFGKTVFSPCHLAGILQDTNCETCKFNVNDLPSRQRITKAEEVVSKLDETAVRSGILEKLSNDLDTAMIPDVEGCKRFIERNLAVGHGMCKDIEKSTREQNECREWYQLRKCRLTASLFGCVMKRRKSIYPESPRKNPKAY